ILAQQCFAQILWLHIHGVVRSAGQQIRGGHLEEAEIPFAKSGKIEIQSLHMIDREGKAYPRERVKPRLYSLRGIVDVILRKFEDQASAEIPVRVEKFNNLLEQSGVVEGMRRDVDKEADINIPLPHAPDKLHTAD